VHIDYHVEVDGHYYSVPYSLVRQQRDVRLSAQRVELCHRGKRVASHQRSPRKGRHTTVAVHMPKAHQHSAEWTPHRRGLWAAKTGAAIAPVGETMLASRPQPQQGFRACLGRMRLGKRSGEARLAAACQRARRSGACSSKSIESLLKHALDQQPLPGPPAAAPVITHSNIRGAQYDHMNQGDPVC
jgi:transposase